MIKDILYILIFVGLFASCDSEQFSSGLEDEVAANNVLKLNISRADFSDMEEDDSRVSNSGISTSFTEGDVIGVLVTQDGKNYNLPYRYNGTNWEFDTSSGKELFTKTATGELTFLLYYPYSAEADGVTTLEDLKSKFPVRADQSMETDYIASDLLYAEVTTETSTISAEMKHLRALFTYKPRMKFQTTVAGEGNFEFYALSLTDVTFSDNVGEIKCYKTTDGEYRYIVDKGNTITWVYDYADTVYEGKKELSTVTPGTKYAVTEIINMGVYDESKAKIGDFYCIDGDKGYILPQEFDIVSSTHTCIGIVFHVGVGTGDSKGNYDETPLASNGIRGYAVALKDVGNLSWATEEGKSTLTDSDESKWDGYSNNQTVKSVDVSLNKFPAFKACAEVPSAALNSSGWYLPSIAQLGDIKNNIAILQPMFAIVEGECLKTDGSIWYWSSTQKGNNNDQAVILYGTGYSVWDKTSTAYVRPVLTF